MRGIKRGLASLITIIAVCSATDAFATEAYTTATIWLRTGPYSNFPRIELVPRNSFVDVFGCTDGYSWCDVDYEGERGWLPASRLQFVYNGQRGTVNNLAPLLGLMILEFSLHDYWSNHYQNRSWYNEHNLQRWQNWQPPRPQHRTQPRPPTQMPVPPTPEPNTTPSLPSTPQPNQLLKNKIDPSSPQQPLTNRPSSGGTKGTIRKKCVPPEICNQ